jgi:hypothetical protein
VILEKCGLTALKWMFSSDFDLPRRSGPPGRAPVSEGSALNFAITAQA